MTELRGVGLARQALVAAREAAKKNGGTITKKPKRRTSTVVQRDGREPLRLGAAIGLMMTERGMAAPAADGSVLARFDAILAAAVPEPAGRVRAVKFDADTGRLIPLFVGEPGACVPGNGRFATSQPAQKREHVFHFWGSEYGAGTGWLDACIRWCESALGLRRVVGAPLMQGLGSRGWRAGR
ncbi:hypothetical protein ACIRU8_43095 [Streptomyces sp. NPDC101175]|uniref:hypothetical protein n=1 Tax=Streptomyces sp. NPDC101175 TaxID=3366123 RepID=UPI0038345200